MPHCWKSSVVAHISRSHRLEFPNEAVPQSLKIVLILANSVDTEEMLHSVAFPLGLHCLPKYLFSGF